MAREREYGPLLDCRVGRIWSGSTAKTVDGRDHQTGSISLISPRSCAAPPGARALCLLSKNKRVRRHLSLCSLGVEAARSLVGAFGTLQSGRLLWSENRPPRVVGRRRRLPGIRDSDCVTIQPGQDRAGQPVAARDRYRMRRRPIRTCTTRLDATVIIMKESKKECVA